MTFKRISEMTRRSMLRNAATASGMTAIFKMTGGTASAQQPPAGARTNSGGDAQGFIFGGRGRRGPNVRYGPINKYSSPSDLRITDMRAVTVAANYDYHIIRLDTNQVFYGLGEVRDAGSKNSALMLKPYVVGANPLDITGVLRRIRSF